MKILGSITFASALIIGIAFNAYVQPSKDEAFLMIENRDGSALALTEADLTRFTFRSVEAESRDGSVSTYEGIDLVEILRDAGVSFDEASRRENTAAVVVVEGDDGFKASFTLAELDPAATRNSFVLANRRNGLAIPNPEGPLRLIIPHETQHQSRRIRNVTKITITNP